MPKQNQGCLPGFFRLFSTPAPQQPLPLPYRTKDSLLSPAELSFYGVLRLVVGERMVICPQMKLDNIFYVATKEQWRSHQNRIDRKTVDFLLCHPQTMSPLMGIELDDASHQREDRQDRDITVEGIFEAAGLPIVRIPVRSSYSVEEISGLLRQAQALHQSAPQRAATGQAEAAPLGAPICPKCGIPMVGRIGRQDKVKFWGCPNYPNCKQTIKMA